MTVTQTILTSTMTQQQRRYDTVVIGLGKTGLSCVRFLAGQAASLAVVDSRSNPPELDNLRRDYPDVPVYCGPFGSALPGCW